MHTTIVSQLSLDAFLESVDHFHDAILREVAVLAHGYVDSELRMFGDVEPYDVRFIIQMQSADTPVIELIFEDVNELALQPAMALAPSGSFKAGEITLRLGDPLSGVFVGVRARRGKYQVLDRSHLGQGLLAVIPIPADRSTE
jgi:hypothetical protein